MATTATATPTTATTGTSLPQQKKMYGISQQQTTSTEERCKSCSTFYQSKFSDVPALSSETLLNEYLASSDVVLVDCRTLPERNVSMIEGAISLKEFENAYHQRQFPNDVPIVVTYCTIGYRSGMEARRLQQKYNLTVQSLDGIVSFTHALEKHLAAGKTSKISLVDPKTKKKTTNVHCFGSVWACPDDRYTPISYPFPILLLRTVQVGATLMLRTLQSLGHTLRSCRKPKVD
jgi:rhodanese-related sulfurtransferase